MIGGPGRGGRKRCGLLMLVAIVLSGLNICAQGYEGVLFEDGFESGEVYRGPAPKWSWDQPYDVANSGGPHMMYGPGDIYEVSDDLAHTGKYSLRLNFAGRNGFCNVCGTKKFEARGVGTPTAQLVSDEGEVLPANSALAAADRVFYNRSDYFAQWGWDALRSALLGQGGAPEVNNMLGTGIVQSGDALLRPNQCGIDGSVGGNIERRSDCDRAINYFRNVSAQNFPFGGILSRRFYIYIPKKTVLPENTFKLGYSFFGRPGDDGVEKRSGQIIVLSTQRGVQLEISNELSLGSMIFTGERLKRDTWYYIEEVWQRESSLSVDDGQFWLYFAESGKLVEKPLIHREGARFGKLLSMSIHGNWQHLKDVSGYVYFDDIHIANHRVGPVKAGKAPGNPSVVSARQVK